MGAGITQPINKTPPATVQHAPSTSTHQDDDRNGSGRPWLPVQLTNAMIQEYLDHTLYYGKVVYVLGNGHCLRRALGKIDNMSPGEVVKKTTTKEPGNTSNDTNFIYQ